MAKKSSLADALLKNKPVVKKETKPAYTAEEKKPLIIRLDPAAKKQLQYLAIEQDSSQQGLMTEALNDLFVKYRKDGIA